MEPVQEDLDFSAVPHGTHGNIDILVSIPGVGFIIGSSILAETGDVSQFDNPKQLVSWAGLSPAVYESAGKTAHGHITKRGSKYLRTMLIEAAQSIAGGKPNRLKHFFSRIQSRKGYKKAIGALARNVLSIVHHLLANHEKYAESPGKEKKTKLPDICPDRIMDHDEMIHILTQAGYIIHTSHPAMESPESSLSYAYQMLSLVVGCFSYQQKNLHIRILLTARFHEITRRIWRI